MTRPFGKVARAMAKMEVGEEIVFDVRSNNAIHGAAISARKILDNPAAVWGSRKVDGKWAAYRWPDGSTPKRWPAPQALALAEMEVGDSILLHMPRRQIEDSFKVAARRWMGNPSANWAGKTTTLGMRIRRTA